VITYGTREDATVRGLSIQTTGSGSIFELDFSGQRTLLATNAVGAFNVHNILAALSVALKENIPLEVLKTLLLNMPQVPGRLERVCAARNLEFSLFVDFAHTPRSMECILKLGRSLMPKRVIVVFGCGGDRDPSKRKPMGEIAASSADVVIVTSDNPRTEDEHKIIAEILVGIDPQHNQPLVIPDRREAIYKAVSIARPGDAIFILGKGDENEQIIGKECFPFHDRTIAEAAISEIGW
jgi:UDP-N-acetylmuramoyl-L-alanyl-D-glutamate--2,6-diaminopimelate ligase